MADSFLPSTDSGLLAWSRNLSQRINADGEAVGISPERAAAFQVLLDEYEQAYLAAMPSGSRCKALVVEKNRKRAALRDAARLIVATVNGHVGVSNEQRASLGLTIRRTGRSAVAAPAYAPNIHVVSSHATTVELRVSDSQVTRRGRPRGTVGAAVFYALGSRANGETGWELAGFTIDNRLTAHLPADTPPGTPAHFRAQWLGTRLDRGPWSSPVTINIAGGFGRPRAEKMLPARAAA